MNAVLRLRDSLRYFYSRFDYIIRPLIKIALAMVVLFAIRARFGYNDTLSKPLFILAASVLCGFFPYGFITFMAAFFMVVNMFEVSVVMAAFMLLTGFLIFMLYFGFKPGTGLIIALVPLAFYFKLPYLLPVILGLKLGASSSVAAVLGVFAFYTVNYFSVNADALAAMGSADMINEFVMIAEGIFKDKYMYVVMTAFAACVIAVSLISKSSVEHCWTLAVSAGIVIESAFIIIGGAVFKTGTFVPDLVELLISLALSLLYVFIIYPADFRGTEYLNYEDDDYYYYVRAVPKIKPDDADGRL